MRKIMVFFLLTLSLNVGVQTNAAQEVSKSNNMYFIDSRDQSTYSYVAIGTQIWMRENLTYLPKIRKPEKESYEEPYYYVYDYQGSSVSEAKATESYKKYGVLYNWAAALKACPAGWHLPSDEEWQVLEEFLGMGSSSAVQEEWRQHGDGGKKLKSTSGWYNDGNGNNESGFTALPSGNRGNNGVFYMGGMGAVFWSSTVYNTLYSFTRSLEYSYDGLGRSGTRRTFSHPIRCLKDE